MGNAAGKVRKRDAGRPHDGHNPVPAPSSTSSTTSHAPSDPTLTVRETAKLIGRSADWLYRNWRHLHGTDGFPPPILSHSGKGGGLTWSRLQVYAWLDRELAPELAERVAVLRLAADALAGADPAADSEIARWRTHLDREFRHG